jgi:hypothetical protein
MEVHAPEHPIHTWREFFIHMGTICLGLLIAIGLEQTVEAFHHHNELRELRDSLHQDGEKTLTDCDRINTFIRSTNTRSAAQAAAARDAFAHHQPLIVAPYQDATDWDLPTDPTWQAAKASGLIALVPQNEIKVASEIDMVTDYFANSFPAYVTAASKVSRFETRFRLQTGSTAIPPEELQTYLDLLQDKTDILNYMAIWNQQLHNATAAALSGETNLSKIQDAERQ